MMVLKVSGCCIKAWRHLRERGLDVLRRVLGQRRHRIEELVLQARAALPSPITPRPFLIHAGNPDA